MASADVVPVPAPPADEIIVPGTKDRQVMAAAKTDTPLIKTTQVVTVIDRDELIRATLCPSPRPLSTNCSHSKSTAIG